MQWGFKIHISTLLERSVDFDVSCLSAIMTNIIHYSLFWAGLEKVADVILTDAIGVAPVARVTVTAGVVVVADVDTSLAHFHALLTTRFMEGVADHVADQLVVASGLGKAGLGPWG